MWCKSVKATTAPATKRQREFYERTTGTPMDTTVTREAADLLIKAALKEAKTNGV